MSAEMQNYDDISDDVSDGLYDDGTDDGTDNSDYGTDDSDDMREQNRAKRQKLFDEYKNVVSRINSKQSKTNKGLFKTNTFLKRPPARL